MHNGEDAFATHPIALLVANLTVVEDSCFVELHSSAVDGSREGNLIRMEVFPTRFSNYLLGRIAEDISH